MILYFVQSQGKQIICGPFKTKEQAAKMVENYTDTFHRGKCSILVKIISSRPTIPVYYATITDKKPNGFFKWNVNHDEMIPGYTLYVTLDPCREYEWQRSIDTNNIYAVKN